jgi:hypothetical protein
VFAKEPPTERILTITLANDRLVIPPGAPNHQVSSKFTLANGATLLSFFPHMHVVARHSSTG